MVTAAAATAPASLPDPDLPGISPGWSRLVDVVDADGLSRRFHLLDTGPDSGPRGTVVCVHGNPTWSYLWRRLLADPPTGWRVIAVDQLGMGWSERIGRPRRLPERIDDLGRLLDVVVPDGRVVTVAHDWGGPIALGWAVAHPERLAAVVLANTAVHQPTTSSAPALIRAARAPGLVTAVCRATPVFVRGTTALSRPRLAPEIRDAFAAPYATAARRQAVADFVADIPLEENHVSRASLAAVADAVSSLTVPAFLAWGPSDPVFADRYLRDLVARLPHADVHRYVGASHLVTEDAPQALDDIRAWIEALDPQTPGGAASAAVDGARPVPPAASRRTMGAALGERARDGLHSREPAVVEMSGDGRRITWRQLDAVVTQLAVGLLDAGVRPGDRVALLVPPGADLAAALYACWRIGAVIVVADAGLGIRGLARALRGAWPDHLIAVGRGLVAARMLRLGGRRFAAGRLARAEARALGAETTLSDLVARGRRLLADGFELPESPEPDDLAAVVFTSGATGPAKGVTYRHSQVEANRDVLMRLYAVTAEDRLVAAFAPFALYGPAMGIPSVVPDMDVTRPATLSAVRLAEAVEAVNGTLVWASPAALRHVVDTAGELAPRHSEALGSVRLLMSAGAPVSPTLLASTLEHMPGATAHTPYGMTEVLPVADISLDELLTVDGGEGVCVGAPVHGAEVRIEPLHAGSPTGEILVRAPWGKEAYDRLWGTEARSRADSGWHRTGDVGHLDGAGRLWVEGRLQHLVETAHGPVTPVGVEQRVEALVGVRAAACVGIGPVGAQVVVLVVVPKAPSRRRQRLADPVLAAEVRGAAGCDVAAVLVRDALPVDIRHNAKVDRTALAEWAASVLS